MGLEIPRESPVTLISMKQNMKICPYDYIVAYLTTITFSFGQKLQALFRQNDYWEMENE